MKPTLRLYQTEAVNKMVWARQLEGNDLISLPQGSGKSLVISELAKQLNEPILILTPSKELLEQDKEKLEHWTPVNVYSAGMKEKTIGNITLGTIQSVYKNPELFTDFKVVIVDECDEINPKKLAGMYHKLFRGMGAEKVYGLTATPFRNDFFYRSWGNNYWQKETVHTIKLLTRYRERFWNRMLYVAHAKDLIDQGYLAPLTYHKMNLVTQDKLSFNKSKSEFDLEDFEEKFNPFLQKTSELIRVMIKRQVLVFAATITQAENLQKLIPLSEVVTGNTPNKERARIVKGFRDGTIRVVINVGVLLIGFDKPDLQNIVICRPTRSLRLHMQLLGRGMRPFAGKSSCEVYDLVGNVDTLGEAESMRVEKIDNKWNVTTNTFPGGFHLQELYTFKLKLKPTDSPDYLGSIES